VTVGPRESVVLTVERPTICRNKKPRPYRRGFQPNLGLASVAKSGQTQG
jgi:hypothetical protein